MCGQMSDLVSCKHKIEQGRAWLNVLTDTQNSNSTDTQNLKFHSYHTQFPKLQRSNLKHLVQITTGSFKGKFYKFNWYFVGVMIDNPKVGFKIQWSSSSTANVAPYHQHHQFPVIYMLLEFHWHEGLQGHALTIVMNCAVLYRFYQKYTMTTCLKHFFPDVILDNMPKM